MYRLNPVAAQVLLGLEAAEGRADSNPTALITHCYEMFHSIPTYAEFAEAFNKLLYISALTIDGEKVSLADFGRDLINNARGKVDAKAQQNTTLEYLNKELSGYKLKSMCNRKVWSEAQYQQAADLCGKQ
ncbi:MAG TPA: hypothetical protein VLC79_00935 [Cellvibrio sp.]|nr:hypothetical protein [Cellvibrio sp.]